ncbi:hypothetical protein FUT87_12520 [Mitsuaria sp. TWR114]|uniref:hypothetical protein n=1 Tax=Mitsuaria sp. TWR114 TaxID=2601731 RepID=UPI0011BF0FEF|nr:hypothetical protein [Mitsuaria sp. TWR114]TXD87280.1 hypothetical protein FUT87_12520 [Mitsuaria sp. TWR114]
MRAAPLLLRLAVVLAGSVCMAGAAWAQQGLQLKPDRQAFTHWQARLQVSQSQDDDALSFDARRGSRLLSANLLADYYLTGSGLGAGTRGGLRATGGLMLGPMSLLQSSSGLALGRGAALTPSLSAGSRSLSLLTGPDREPNLSLSYVASATPATRCGAVGASAPTWAWSVAVPRRCAWATARRKPTCRRTCATGRSSSSASATASERHRRRIDSPWAPPSAGMSAAR